MVFNSFMRRTAVGLLALCALASAAPTESNHISNLAKRLYQPPSSASDFQPPSGWQSKPPGTILNSRTLDPNQLINPAGGFGNNVQKAYQFLYRTTDALNNASYTVTTLLVPPNANTSILLGYQVAYDDADEDCSPSYTIQKGANTGGESQLQIDLIAVNGALNKGWYVALADYEGHNAAFLAGPQTAHGVLDSVRAVLKSDANIATGLSTSASVLLWGYSGGAFATEWAVEYQGAYAPELSVTAAAMGGIPVNITNVIFAVNNSTNAGLIPTGILGLSAAYPNISTYVNQQLIPSNASYFRKPLSECSGQYGDDFKNQDIFAYYFTRGQKVLYDPIPQSVLNNQVMGYHGNPVTTLYFYKGVKDEIAAPIGDTDALYYKYCPPFKTPIANVQYYRYASGTHESVAINGLPGALKYLNDRVTGAFNPGLHGACARFDQP